MKGNRVRAARKKKHWSQEDLALKSGIGQALISKIETGAITEPTATTIKRLAFTLGVSADFLLGVFDELQEQEVS